MNADDTDKKGFFSKYILGQSIFLISIISVISGMQFLCKAIWISGE